MAIGAGTDLAIETAAEQKNKIARATASARC
jgi:hypothetical protein